MEGHLIRRARHWDCCWPLQDQTIMRVLCSDPWSRPIYTLHEKTIWADPGLLGFMNLSCYVLKRRVQQTPNSVVVLPAKGGPVPGKRGTRLSTSPRGAPVPAPLQRRQSHSRRASGPAPRDRGRPVTGKYFPRLFQLIIFRPGGFSSASSPGRSAWPYPGPQPQSGSKIAGPNQCRAARVRRRPTPGPRPRSSDPVCSCRSPPPPQNGKPSGPARPGPDYQQGRGPSPAPGSPSPPGVCTGAETAPQRPRPPALVVLYVSRCRTARSGASRLRISIGPSGAEQLSVRHVQLRGHAP
ncbi:hypothetical protein NDU88_005716 [Pleurodeles waltl]|uniref:Uncharacterized protein n=1 Tax=Pleurodeles waltl TaxID=8319 RepID=A0AAV7NR21_PLEWA|nr:hypothetical protein NDU88_005716 [Pleurodeles waltl]